MTTGSMTSSRKPRMKSSSRLASISASSSSALASDFMSSGSRRRTFLIGAGMLRGEACEPVELGLRQLAIVGDDHEMILHQAEHLDGKPQPLARVGVARRGVAPALDVIGLDLREDVFERLAAEQLLGARAARNCRLELVIDHLSLSAWTAGSSPAVTIICRRCFSETGGILVLLHRRRRRRMGGIGNRLDGGARHLVLVALARDLQVEQLELLLERELLAFEGELRIELHLLVREIGRAHV